MANGSSSSGATKGGAGGGLGDGHNRGGKGPEIGKMPAKKAPFRPFKEYQKEFERTKDAQSLKKVLEDNGVPISDKLEKYIVTGKYPIEQAKLFIKGSLLTISHYGEGNKFLGFGAFMDSNSGTVAFYRAPTITGAQSNGVIAVNIGHPKSRTKEIYGTGAHEGYHHVQGVLGDATNQSMNRYSENVVASVYPKWVKKARITTGNIKTDFAAYVSMYGASSNAEALSEAMKNVIMKKGKASTLSKDIFKQVRADAKRNKTGKYK